MRSLVSTHVSKHLLPVAVLLILTCLLLSACDEATTDQSVTTSPQQATITAPIADIETAPQEVTFATEDGLTLSGTLYGSGIHLVVLAHMYPADQTSWAEQAQRLADMGYLVLTFDFRGYGDSEGSKDIANIDRDVRAAADGFLEYTKATDIVLVGASMGGTACLNVASGLQGSNAVRLAGVISYSAQVEFMGQSAQEAVPAIQVPMLFIAAENDEGAAGAQALYDLSGGTADLQILSGGDHGTNLFLGTEAAEAERLLDEFLAEYMPLTD